MERGKGGFSYRGLELGAEVSADRNREHRRFGRYAVRTVPGLCDGAVRRRGPDAYLALVGDQLQRAVGDLEVVMFEAPGIGGSCRTDVHDAISLVMEALQMLGQARESLERSRTPGTPTKAELLAMPPLARA